MGRAGVAAAGPPRLPRDMEPHWVPAYVALGQFDRANLPVAAWLLPVAIGSTLAGVWLVRRVPSERFINIIYALMVLVGAKLIFDGLAGL